MTENTLTEAERETLLHWLHGGQAGGILCLWRHVECILADRLAAAWDEGAYAGRTYQQEIQRHAHWSHIGKASPKPIRNPHVPTPEATR